MKSEVLLLVLLHVTRSVLATERDTVTIEGDRGVVIVKTDPLEALRFIRQPEDTEVVEKGSVTLHCTVETVAEVEYLYRWYKLPVNLRNIQMNEGTVISEANKAELLLPSVQAHHAGQYICSVTIVGTDYTVISNNGQLKVYYYSGPEVPEQPERSIEVQKNQDYQALECGLPESYPQVEAVWYKDGEKIADNRRMFILPEDTSFSREKLNAGALIIMYIARDDEGTYHCKTTYNDAEYTLNTYSLSVVGEVQTSNKIAPSQVIKVEGESTYGGEATLFCAGIGKPAPYISWTKMDGSRVETSEKFLLQDSRRRLIITNVNDQDGTSYTCSVKVSGVGHEKTQIVSMTIVPSPSAQITFLSSPVSQVIYTNTYPPFSLMCSIDLTEFIGVEGSNMPVLYWLKNGNQLGFSNRRKSKTRQDSATNTLESSIEFLAPNDSDLGVYQCIGRGTSQLRQVIAYVNVRNSGSDYEVEEVETMYKVINVPKSVSAAEEHCRSWKSNGHLVSIMNRKEADTVTSLLNQEGINQVWIGLTSERTAGDWKWTQPADDSQKFSFWTDEMPDNWGGNKNYAIMDRSREGRWLDVKNKGSEYPFVCKQYNSWCPSVREYYDNTLEPLNKVESKDTKYGVGESITVTCTDRTVTKKETLTCTTAGKYEPELDMFCPTYNNAPSSILLSSTLLVVSVVTLLVIS